MSKTVMIQALPVPGFSGHGEAHRYWPSADANGNGGVKVEILDQEDDGPLVPVKRVRAGEEIVEMDHDMTKIGQRSYRAIKRNPRIRILEEGGAIAEAETAALQEAADKLTAENLALKADVSNLDGENLMLRAQLDEALKRLGEKPGNTVQPVQSDEVPAPTPGSVAPVGTVVPEDDGAGDAHARGHGKGKDQSKKAASK